MLHFIRNAIPTQSIPPSHMVRLTASERVDIVEKYARYLSEKVRTMCVVLSKPSLSTDAVPAASAVTSRGDRAYLP